MDRSQVRQFGMNRSIYSSKVIGMNSSILHSPRTNTEREIHLRKSRIANIPDSKNIDLSDKLDFVVVFQAIEIERMAEEIETSRSRIKEYERQLFNCDNYEIQIKQLTERCYRLESQKNAYREELYDNKRASELIFNELQEIKKRYVTVDFTSNQKYKLERNRNDELVLQVQKWKARYNALDESKSKQLQTIKKMMEEQSKSHLSRQTKELFDRFEIEKQEMEQLIRNLKQMNLQKETELKKFKFELENKDKQMDEMERQVDEYEEKIALLSQEHYRFTEMNKSKQNEINKLKDKLKETQDNLAKINQQFQSKNEEFKKLTQKIKKIEETSTQKDSKLNKLEKMALTDKERLSELDRIVFLLKQRENQIESKTKMLERKDKRVISLEQSLKSMQETQNSMKNEISIMKQQNESSSQVISQLLQRIDYLTQILKKLWQSTEASEAKIKTHNTSFRQEINKKTQQIMAYSHKLMSELRENQDYINKLQEVVRENGQKISNMERDKMNVLQKLQELKEYQHEYDKLYSEATSLKTKMNRAVQQNDRLLQQNRSIQEQKQVILQEKSALVKERNTLMKERDRLIEEAEMKQSEIMNQTQMQIRVLEDKYENNIVKNMKLELVAREREVSELKGNMALMQRRSKDAERQFTKRQEQLRQNLESLTKNYQSTIKNQVQPIINRIQAMQSTIKTLKHIIGEKLIKDQKAYVQRYKLQEKQIYDLIDTNMILMDKNNKLYDSLISSTTIDTKSVETLSHNQSGSPKRLDEFELTTVNTIYTSNNQTTKTILSPRGVNQNYNSSNIVGAGTKIKETAKGNFSNETSTNIPIEFLIKHVILCAQVESLRQRIGDKNAKVQKMKNSLMVSNVSSNKSFVAVVNGNTKMANEQIHQTQGEMMLQSNLMSSTLINKLTSPFTETSFIQSRLIDPGERFGTVHERETNIRRVTSEERYNSGGSPESSSILQNSQNKNNGIYTNRMGMGAGMGMGVGRSGFKSIGIKKCKIYN